MGTSWSARLVLADAALAAGWRARIAAVLDGVVAEMSPWVADSDISRFNRSRIGDWQALPAGFDTVLAAALDIAARSDGAFDPAIGALVNHWGFGPEGAPGSAAPLAGAWRRIAHRRGLVSRSAEVSLDFSGIAKGYGVDAVADILRAGGIANFLIEIGGELRGEGIKPDGQPWWVDLEGVPGLAVPKMRVAMCGLAVATSGDYRRFHMGGSHSIDPRSGAPIRHDVASVTVLHPSAMLADGWATALTVMGQAAGMALAKKENLAARMITRAGAGAVEALSPALAAMLG